jgi:hypothetical protein
MPLQHQIDVRRLLVWTRTTGRLTLDGLQASYALLKADPRFRPTMSHLIDSRLMAIPVMDPGELRRLAQVKIFSPQSRRALIVPDNPLAFGLARMYQLYRETLEPSAFNVFISYEAAFRWLDLELDAQPPERFIDPPAADDAQPLTA